MIIPSDKDNTTSKRVFFIVVLCVVTAIATFVLLYVFKHEKTTVLTDKGTETALSENVFQAPEEIQDTTLSIAIVGDMMFDRAVRRKINNQGFDSVWGDTKGILAPYDIKIGNLEGPITSYPSRTLLPSGKTAKILSFTFPTSTASELKKVGFDAVSLANNHTDNFGTKGLKETRDALVSADIYHFGDPANEQLLSTVLCDKKSFEQCVAIVGFHEFAYIKANEQKVIEEIQMRKTQGYYTIVYPHWGAEYKQTHTQYQQNLARSWIDAGADLVVGAHPHVVAHAEEYKGKMIFYSLGNFIFDQYFSFNTTHGLVLGIHIPFDNNPTTNKLIIGEPTFDLIPITNEGIVVKKLTTETYDRYERVLSVFASSSPVWKKLNNK